MAVVDVFISYSWSDGSQIAEELSEHLKAAGLSVWHDREAALGSPELPKEIGEAIARSRAVVLILTQSYSQGAWTWRELGVAIGLGKLVIPVLRGVTLDSMTTEMPILSSLLVIPSGDGLKDIAAQVANRLSAAQTEKPDIDELKQEYCRRLAEEHSSIHHISKQDSGAPLKDIDSSFIPVRLARSTGLEIDTNPGRDPARLFLGTTGPGRYLVRGMPGSGKTTLLRFLAHRYAQDFLDGHRQYLPIWVQLRDLGLSGGSIADLIKQSIASRLATKRGVDLLYRGGSILRDPTIVLLDGLDEIEGALERREAIRTLEELGRKYQACIFIVASRPIAEIRETRKRRRGFQILDLQPLTQKMIRQFVNSWFFNQQESCREIQELLESNARIGSLATNPFLLSMICATHAGSSGSAGFIRNRSDLYARCTEYLIRRLYEGEAQVGQLDFQQTLELLKDVSIRFFLWQEQDFPPDHVHVIGARVLGTQIAEGIESVLDKLQRKVGLIQRSGAGYTFVHKSLWEYFSALALVDRGPRFVICHAGDPDWEEVIRLYTGLRFSRDRAISHFLRELWFVNRPLAIRAASEVGQSAELIRGIAQEREGNVERLLLIDSLEQSLQLLPSDERAQVVEETLRTLLIECEERDCEVIFRADELLDRLKMTPLAKGGVLYRLFDLEAASERQRRLLEDPAMHFSLIEVDGGQFWMGEHDQHPNEAPRRLIEVGSFWMSKHPLTNRIARQFPFLATRIDDRYPDDPVVGLTWFEARYVAMWIGCRLPSEVEWEYAARGGRNALQGPYYFDHTQEALERHIWYGDQKRDHPHSVNEVNPETGQPNLNPLGLANMLGNVWEWCEEIYHDKDRDFHRKEILSGARIMRGGTFRGGPDTVRCGRRVFAFPSNRGSTVGVRVVAGANPAVWKKLNT